METVPARFTEVNPSSFRVREFDAIEDGGLVNCLMLKLVFAKIDFNFSYEPGIYRFVIPSRCIRPFDQMVIELRAIKDGGIL